MNFANQNSIIFILSELDGIALHFHIISTTAVCLSAHGPLTLSPLYI